jgi:hypothetical protein
MTLEKSELRRAGTVGLEELTEQAIRGVARARSTIGKDGILDGPITIGVILEPPDRDGDGPLPPILDRPDIIPLRTGNALGRTGLGKLSDALSQDRALARNLADAIRHDFAGTLSELFELTPEQYSAARRVTEVQAPELARIGTVMRDAVGGSEDLDVSVEIDAVSAKSKDEDEKGGIDWSIEVGGECNTDKDCKATAKLVIKF